MKLPVIDACLTKMQIAPKVRNSGVWIISTLNVLRGLLGKPSHRPYQTAGP